ncbi:MAG TPA: 4Fe-4S dicluster domain-containing protein [Vicinamibacteria bacterium]|nr:4Fe-4S dicluster domain-containing protein [Vicinamibacteria bacterium]
MIIGERYQLAPKTLEAIFAALARDGVRVLAPRRVDQHVALLPVKSLAEVALDAVQASGSAKAAVFPPVEQLLSFTGSGQDLRLQDPEPTAPPTVVFGIRPCEARAFKSLQLVFDWDSPDTLFDAHLAMTTVVSLGCTQADEACFCTSVGGGPRDTQGSDLLLQPLQGGGFAADVLTAKGQALLGLAGELLPLGPEGMLEPAPEVEPAFDAARLPEALEAAFDSPVWGEESLRCLGCGTCAFVCPTCSCFDIQDEKRDGGGRRLRCWDSCGLHQFTLHASGHNPRETQGQRWRQRVSHKFLYFPERFSAAACVGCGKCARACPADMSLKEFLRALTRGR